MTEAHHFEAFMRDYQDMVFSTAFRLVANQAEAEDISQEVFLKAYERYDQLRNSPTVGGWLKTVTTNLSLNHLTRYRARWRFFSELVSSQDETDMTLEIPAPESVHQDLEAADLRHAVQTALLKLPTSQRVPLTLFHLEGKSYEEIAQALGISLSKVKIDIFRARETLRRKLKLHL